LGQGTYSEIFAAQDVRSGDFVAIKLEASNSDILNWETNVLKRMQRFPFISRLIALTWVGKHRALVMELLGENLTELRLSSEKKKLSVRCALRISLQMLDCVQVAREVCQLFLID
jgi:serine/threonine protein kinase